MCNPATHPTPQHVTSPSTSTTGVFTVHIAHATPSTSPPTILITPISHAARHVMLGFSICPHVGVSPPGQHAHSQSRIQLANQPRREACHVWPQHMHPRDQIADHRRLDSVSPMASASLSRAQLVTQPRLSGTASVTSARAYHDSFGSNEFHSFLSDHSVSFHEHQSWPTKPSGDVTSIRPLKSAVWHPFIMALQSGDFTSIQSFNQPYGTMVWRSGSTPELFGVVAPSISISNPS